jgi:hypothetical protein
MERDRKGLRSPHHHPGALEVNTRVPHHQAKDDSVHSKTLSHRYISSHLEAFHIRVPEVARARPDHDKDRQSHSVAHRAHQLFGWSKPAQAQVRAKFDALRAAALCGNRSLHGLYRYFKKYAARHEQTD